MLCKSNKANFLKKTKQNKKNIPLTRITTPPDDVAVTGCFCCCRCDGVCCDGQCCEDADDADGVWWLDGTMKLKLAAWMLGSDLRCSDLAADLLLNRKQKNTITKMI